MVCSIALKKEEFLKGTLYLLLKTLLYIKINLNNYQNSVE